MANPVFSFKSMGTYDIECEVKLLINNDDSFTFDERYEISNSVQAAIKNILSKRNAEDPEKMIAEMKERDELLSAFPSNIFVQLLPYGYCNDYCCSHRKWYKVWTVVGPITIGWRKHVISIDYSESLIHDISDMVTDNVTKGKGYIHASTLDKAKEYVELILNGGIELNNKECE